MPSTYNPDTRLFESDPAGEPQVEFTRFDLPGEAPDFGIQLETGERFRIKVKMEARHTPVHTASSDVQAAEFDVVLTGSMIDEAGALVRDDADRPIVFAPYAAGVNADYDGDGDLDYEDAIAKGLAFYAAIIRNRARRAIQARAMAARYGLVDRNKGVNQ